MKAIRRLRALTITAIGVIILEIPAFAAPLMGPSEPLNHEISFADFSGDGKADLAVRSFLNGNVTVYYNQGSTFSSSPNWIGTARSVPDGINWDALFADMNGDGRADLINRSRSDGGMFVHLNTGNDFQSVASTLISGVSPASPDWKTILADVNGDALADLVNVNLTNGTVFVHYNTNIGYSPGAHIAQTSLGVPTSPYSGWEPLLADCSGDGKADYVNFSHPSSHLFYHEFSGSNFSTVSNKDIRGPREHFEHEYFLANTDSDPKADLIQHNLRTGEILVYSLRLASSGEWYYGQNASMKYTTVPYARPNTQRPIQEDARHVLNAMMWYDNDYFPGNARPDNGWWPMNPNNLGPAPVPPGGCPVNGLNEPIYRSGTALLGTYDLQSEPVIKQHAYWLRAIGINVVLIDWTNMVAARDPDNGGIRFYHDGIRAATQNLINTYANITEFSPPKVCIVIRMPGNNDTVRAGWVADEVYGYYTQSPGLWYTFNDSSADKNKPMMLTFVDFAQPGWNAGPQWSDSRFNMRYSNGYLINHGLTTAEDNDWNRVSGDLPYWNFVENTPHPTKGTGYYKNVYRRLPSDTNYMEQAATWVALHLGGFNWDGQLDVIAGKRTIERYSESMYGARTPRNLLVNRFNYQYARYCNPQEGMSWNYSTMIEPSQQSGFDITYKSAKVVHDLAKLQQRAPGKPVITGYTGSTFSFASSNYPMEYRVSATPSGTGASWTYVNVNQSAVALPVTLHNQPFYFKTRNAFGESTVTAYP